MQIIEERFIVDQVPQGLLIQGELVELLYLFHIWETSFHKTQKQRGIISLFILPKSIDTIRLQF